MYRQGDVLIVPVEEFPEDLSDAPAEREDGSVVLARGELAGHAHRIATTGVNLYVTGNDRLCFLEVPKDNAVLEHEEHAAILLPKGKYQVVRQREYSPGRYERLVAD